MHQTTGPSASAAVFNGEFSVPESANLHGGSYRVRIAMIPASIRNDLPPEQVRFLPPDDAVISPAYDAHSRLSCELKPNQENILKFEVEFLK